MHTSSYLNTYFHLSQSRLSLSEKWNKFEVFPKWANCFVGTRLKPSKLEYWELKMRTGGFSEPGGVPLECLKVFL